MLSININPPADKKAEKIKEIADLLAKLFQKEDKVFSKIEKNQSV